MLQSSTQGNTRPLRPRLLGSPLALRTPLPHTPLSLCRKHRSDTALDSISDCGSRSFHFLCRYLHETEQQLTSVLWVTPFQLADGEVCVSLWGFWSLDISYFPHLFCTTQCIKASMRSRKTLNLWRSPKMSESFAKTCTDLRSSPLL